jgi:hypothetical protein
MKLSELCSLETSEPVVYGVSIDEECFTPPPGLKMIGLVWEGASPDAISDRLIDTIIAFSLSGVEVVVEVEPDQLVDHAYLLTLAGNAGFSVAAVPPVMDEATEAREFTAWHSHCSDFAACLLTTPNFSKTLFPVTGFLSYLIAERLSGATAMQPNDRYTLDRFVNAVDTAASDETKAIMRERFAEVLGGHDEIDAYISAIVTGLYDAAEKVVLETVSDSTPS